jgi:hypothetical protein
MSLVTELQQKVEVQEMLILDARKQNDLLKAENAKLRELVSHLMYVKPVEVTAIAHDGKLLRFDEMLAEVGMRFEVEL